MLSSCEEKKEKQTIIVPPPAKEVKHGPHKMPDTSQKRDIEWLGGSYTVSIVRTADESLPLTKDEEGNAYYDNTIHVRIQRADGSDVLNKTFTKTWFASCLEGTATYRDGALLGIVFDKIEGNRLVFASSVGSPDFRSDEFVPMTMTVDANGGISLRLDTKMDTNSDDETDDDEGV